MKEGTGAAVMAQVSLLPVHPQIAVMHSSAAVFTCCKGADDYKGEKAFATSFLMSQVRSATGATRFTSR